MAVPQLLQPHHRRTSSSTGDEDQSVLTYKSPPHRGLPLKKRKFDAALDAGGVGLNHEEGDSENTRRSYSSQGSIIVSSSDGIASSEDDANATTTHRQPVHGEFTSKKPRTGAFGRNFIKNYVMSRDYNALTSNSMNDFMRTHQQKSVDQQQQQQQQQQSMVDFMQNETVGSHQQQQQNMIDFVQNGTVGFHQQQQQQQYRFKCKTCNKSFPTFQALGGHRSSHYDETKDNVRIPSSSSSTTADDNAIVTVVANDHRCNICNKSFPSGRALGGHKRLHWKPFADSSLLKEEMARKKKFEIVLKDDQTGGEDGINLELTL